MYKSSNDSILAQSILKTLLYYDIFKYPLRSEEIFRFMGTNHVTLRDVQNELTHLSKKEILFQFGDFYSIQNDENLVTRRVKGNNAAEKSLVLAKKRAALIGSFPFVRAVMASGSLSKGYMDDQSDLDFFVITSPKRLWIARTLLVIFKRIFLLNSHKNFCVNYFIDTEHLEIEEKNLFTATELCTLLPLYGNEYYETLTHHNRWVHTIFPNYTSRAHADVSSKNVGLKHFLERILTNRLGDKLEQLCLNSTLNRWKKLYQHKYAQEEFRHAFKSKEYVSKNHPNNYQQKVMELLTIKINEFTTKHNLAWHE